MGFLRRKEPIGQPLPEELQIWIEALVPEPSLPVGTELETRQFYDRMMPLFRSAGVGAAHLAFSSLRRFHDSPVHRKEGQDSSEILWAVLSRARAMILFNFATESAGNDAALTLLRMSLPLLDAPEEWDKETIQFLQYMVDEGDNLRDRFASMATWVFAPLPVGRREAEMMEGLDSGAREIFQASFDELERKVVEKYGVAVGEALSLVYPIGGDLETTIDGRLALSNLMKDGCEQFHLHLRASQETGTSPIT